MLTNLKELDVDTLTAAFENNGMVNMAFTEVKYQGTRYSNTAQTRLEFIYNALWMDEEEEQLAITDVYVWVNLEGKIVADCGGCPKYIKDFL